jgi:hypothetical protein
MVAKYWRELPMNYGIGKLHPCHPSVNSCACQIILQIRARAILIEFIDDRRKSGASKMRMIHAKKRSDKTKIMPFSSLLAIFNVPGKISFVYCEQLLA